MERKEALARVPFLKELPETVLAEIAAAGRERKLSRGELLVSERDACLGLIVVLSGAVKVYKLDSRGRELTLGLEAPGSSVSELPLFDGGNYPASAEAAEDGTRVLVVPRDQFQSMMALHPQIAILALRALSIRMRKLVVMLEAQTMHSVRVRLAAYLLRASEGRPTFRLEGANEEIASQIGTVRDVVSRTLGSLRESGAITVSGRTVTVQDRDVLRRIADFGDIVS
ncbi:MAG: transcriptional regulator, Crp/Fnr family [Capsulimonas sp.]|nr:transcriptional regulator, Crp/Fnr family [Capsulimonas sp.]